MPDGRRFGDEYEILLVSNFNNIKPDKSVRYSDIALFGDPDFFSDRNNNIKAGIIEMRPSVEYETLRSVRGNWTSLPGTRNEVDKISEIASENNISSKAFIGDNASETMVKALSGKSPSIMHFATHGYFITSNEEIRHSSFLWQTMGYSRNSHLMLYSGLLFAGADEVWNGKARPNPKDDGILTSDEISRLDFSNTDLVVLSACNTGNGHQNDVDGIMGLRRAFRAAGAGTMVVSLWKVPDDATSRLMQYFYRYLFANHSARESLKYAQQELRNDGYADPYYWASFVVID